MGAVRHARRAREDLLELWLHIARDSEAAANRIYDRIEQKCATLARHPKAGRACPEIASDARSLVIDPWIVFYRLIDDGVQIVRVVDGRRDLKTLEWPSSTGE